MQSKKIRSVAALCIAILYCLSTSVYAEGNPGKSIVWQKDTTCEWIDVSQIESSENDIMLLSGASIRKAVSAHSIGKASPLISLKAGNVVSFDCSYSPASASMDFGILSSNGKFYSINTQIGTINDLLGVSYSGDYYIAIRNNSDQSVTVTGTVEY